MSLVARLAPLERIIRYYQAGIVNTLFGFGLYALFVRLGLNMYVAQLTSHCCGVVFNYFTYSRYAFRGATASKRRFVLSYAGNYLFGLAMLWACAQLIPSPYLAMGVAMVIVTLANYFVLKRLVFVP